MIEQRKPIVIQVDYAIFNPGKPLPDGSIVYISPFDCPTMFLYYRTINDDLFCDIFYSSDTQEKTIRIHQHWGYVDIGKNSHRVLSALFYSVPELPVLNYYIKTLHELKFKKKIETLWFQGKVNIFLDLVNLYYSKETVRLSCLLD